MLSLVRRSRELACQSPEKGASAVEYTLLLVMVALVIILFVGSIASTISGIWSEIASVLF